MKKRASSPGRKALRVLCIVLGLLLALALGVTLYFRQLLGKINYVSPDPAPILSQEEPDASTETDAQENTEAAAPSITPDEIQFSEPAAEASSEGSDVINILLIGQDRREGESRARSDTMILCTFRKDTKQLILTSFLRDLYVEIPGWHDNRINAAYAFGGIPLLNTTLQENFGISIDGNVEVDFNQFAGIVDLLGGVEMELRQDEAELINQELGCSLTEGTQLLSGDQALVYSRIRSLDSDGDFSRTNRQRKVMSALLEACRDSSLTTLLSLLRNILPMITTDMTGAELIRLAAELFPHLSGMQLVSQRIPADGTYDCRTIDGMSVLVADMDAARQLLEETMGGE